jgi:signal transduction histidine kinase
LAPDDTRPPNRSDGLHGFALAHSEPTVVESFADEHRFQVPPAYLQHGLVSGIAVPLTDRGHGVGLLAVRSRKQLSIGGDEVQFLQSLSNLLASSLQRAESEEALAHSQRLESVGQLTGGIAHDFNNLLTIIQGNLQVLEERPSRDEDDRELLASATRAARRAGELTGKLLAFSRRQVLQPARVDVSAMLESLAEMLRRTVDQRVRIAVQVASPCPAVLADPAQLESALLNIAINARDAMPGGGSLTFSARSAADGTVALAVADTGSGMSEAVRERAFEPFFTTKAKGRGTGLGLSTVYGFVTQSKGTIELESSPGAGTTVTLRLPAWREASASPPAGDQGETSLPDGLRVLLVEDEPEVRKVIGTFLRALGITFTEATDGEHALVTLDADSRFDLLLTDVALGPGLRGPDLARHAQQREPRLAVLLMSGFAAEMLTDTDQTLPWELLRKPCTREELAAALSRALTLPRRRMESV